MSHSIALLLGQVVVEGTNEVSVQRIKTAAEKAVANLSESRVESEMTVLVKLLVLYSLILRLSWRKKGLKRRRFGL